MDLQQEYHPRAFLSFRYCKRRVQCALRLWLSHWIAKWLWNAQPSAVFHSMGCTKKSQLWGKHYHPLKNALTVLTRILKFSISNVRLYVSSPTKLFQPPHNGVISTDKELNEIFWRTIRALANDLHEFIHKFKSPSPLRRLASCIASLVLQLI